MTTSAQAILEGEVRELVRRRGIDPIAEPAVMTRLVDEVVTEYQDRSITSALPPMGDVMAASRSVLDAVAGFGPLQPLLDDPGIEEIWVKGRLTRRPCRRDPILGAAAHCTRERGWCLRGDAATVDSRAARARSAISRPDVAAEREVYTDLILAA